MNERKIEYILKRRDNNTFLTSRWDKRWTHNPEDSEIWVFSSHDEILEEIQEDKRNDFPQWTNYSFEIIPVIQYDYDSDDES